MSVSKIQTLVSILLCIVLCLSLVACGPKNTTGSTSGTQTSTPGSTSASGSIGIGRPEDVLENDVFRKTYMGLWLARDADGKLHSLKGIIKLSGKLNMKAGFTGTIEILRENEVILKSQKVTSTTEGSGFVLSCVPEGSSKEICIGTFYPGKEDWSDMTIRFSDKSICEADALSYEAFCHGVISEEVMLRKLAKLEDVFKDYLN